MKVLVTGGAGYIGRILIPLLTSGGYDLTIIDRNFLSYDDAEKKYNELNCKFVKDDIRYFDPNILRGMDAVVDLAALSNDPSGEIDPVKTWDINYLGRVRVARLAKKLGIKKYILASSCSVYGFREDIASETSDVNPLTTYAMANRAAEIDNLSLSNGTFTSTALRFATAFGYSEKMRLDIAINAMTFYAVKTGKIRLMRDGNQYRPFVHIKDISNAIATVIESNDESVKGQIFNIGADRLNVKLSDLAGMVRNSIGIKSEIEMYGDPDNRSYKVSFKKAKEILKFEAITSIEDGIREIDNKIRSGELTDKEQMHTVNYYKKLMEAETDIQYRGYNITSRIL